MIPQDRLFYLESAKLRRDKKWTRICMKNVLRLLNKEKAANGMTANSEA